jgi:large subunit ribosomal protein L10
MPLTRRQKEQLLAGYREGMAVAPHVFVMDFKGVSVNQDTELRRRIREAGGSYAVIKNRLALRAIDKQPLADLEKYFQGPTAVAYCEQDPVGLAKALTEFAKEVPALEVKAGLVEGQPIAAEEVQQIAKLPSREGLVTRLVVLLQSPITGFARILAALPRQFVVVLDQVRRQQEGAGAGG